MRNKFDFSHRTIELPSSICCSWVLEQLQVKKSAYFLLISRGVTRAHTPANANARYRPKFLTLTNVTGRRRGVTNSSRCCFAVLWRPSDSPGPQEVRGGHGGAVVVTWRWVPAKLLGATSLKWVRGSRAMRREKLGRWVCRRACRRRYFTRSRWVGAWQASPDNSIDVRSSKKISAQMKKSN